MITTRLENHTYICSVTMIYVMLYGDETEKPVYMNTHKLLPKRRTPKILMVLTHIAFILASDSVLSYNDANVNTA